MSKVKDIILRVDQAKAAKSKYEELLEGKQTPELAQFIQTQITRINNAINAYLNLDVEEDVYVL